jgi:uncharacterized coiled-coil protein SlyX
MKLHITPLEMGKMYFYDIMMLYNRYEEYVKEENEAQEKQQAEYNEQYCDQQAKYDNMQSQMSQMTQKMGSITPSSITSGFNFPKF